MWQGKLKPEIKAMWVEALRSGEYVQGRRFMRNDMGTHKEYCCLGVLAEITKHSEDHMRNCLPDYDCARGWWEVLPEDYFRARAPVVKVNDEWLPVTHLNDHRQLSFNEIADLIERDL
jgi:hypothetical protein